MKILEFKKYLQRSMLYDHYELIAIQVQNSEVKFQLRHPVTREVIIV